MKTLRYIICILLIAAVIGLLCYNYFVEKNLESRNIIRAVLIIAGAVLTMVRPPKSKVVNKKAVYQKAYSQFVQNAFYDQPQLEKKLYDAIHNYNQNKLSAALSKLEKLRKECQRTADLRAVTVFMALCLDDMQQYEAAITQYRSALSMQNSSTLHSNMGLCYQRLGDFEEAEKCYENAVQADPKNAIALNNLSAMHFRQGNYEQALDAAEDAIEIDGTLRQALTTAAICCGILGYQEEYEQYYRQAVANGANGTLIKNTIQNLDPTL